MEATLFYIDESNNPEYPASYMRELPEDSEFTDIEVGHRFMIADDSGEAHCIMLGKFNYTNGDDLVNQATEVIKELDL